MTPRPRALVSWSSGKDSAWALDRVRREGALEVVGLVTTINREFERVAMHAVREALLDVQARAVGCPLWKVPLPWPCSNEDYDAAMSRLIARAADDGVSVMIFGDLFLEDVRRYRESQLDGTGVEPHFPLWGIETRTLARDMLAAGLSARLTCIDPKSVPRALAGRVFDDALLDELPDHVDPCGENGEFHTFTCAGPMFDTSVAVRPGEITERDGFVYADLLPAAGSC